MKWLIRLRSFWSFVFERPNVGRGFFPLLLEMNFKKIKFDSFSSERRRCHSLLNLNHLTQIILSFSRSDRLHTDFLDWSSLLAKLWVCL